jgi:2'-5' RNA ligase
MTKRLFVSVDLDGLGDDVARVHDLFDGASGLTLTDPEQAHVTLKFLGDTDPDRIPEITDALERAVADADVDPFTVDFGGLGVFPGLDYISVVWLGVRTGTAPLTRLHEAIEAEAVALGFDSEDHDFTPHVTVGRMNHAGGKELVQNVVERRDPDAGTMTVETVRLTESRLTEGGPVYSTVEAVPL